MFDKGNDGRWQEGNCRKAFTSLRQASLRQVSREDAASEPTKSGSQSDAATLPLYARPSLPNKE